ncbi:DUF3106 domain-containing protein [Glaciimonas sp. GG7]
MALIPTPIKHHEQLTDHASSGRVASLRSNKTRTIVVTLMVVLALIIASASVIIKASHAAGVAAVSTTNSTTGELALKPKSNNAAKVTPISDSKANWDDLTPGQKQTLAPLASGWSELKLATRKKWIEISKRYNSMNTTEQARVQERMHDWVNLTPEQRRQVRENYARARKLDTEQRARRWAQYQQLPEEEKQRLAAEAEKASTNKRVTAQILSAPAKNKPAKQIQLTPQPALTGEPASH